MNTALLFTADEEFMKEEECMEKEENIENEEDIEDELADAFDDIWND